MNNAQQRNDIKNRPLTQSDIPRIVEQVIDLLSETGGRLSRMINNGSQDPEASCSSSIMIELPCDVRNIDLAATLSGMMISMND